MLIPIAQLSESPRNARMHFTGLAELAASIEVKGVVQPLLVRPFPGPGKRAYEIIDGHRRYRAAQMAKLSDVPAEVREATDDEAQQLSLISNCQRQDINPAEEGQAYQQLQKEFGLGVPEIAARVAKSETVVRQRLALASLPEKAIAAIVAGELAVTVGLAIARLGDEDQRVKATKVVLAGCEDWEEAPPGMAAGNKRVHRPLTIREALAEIRRDFNLQLKDCGFDLDDGALVAKLGPCSSCPKRSTNQPMLFPDFAAKDDVCTDPSCFAKKKEAGWRQKKLELEAAGKTVLEGEAAAKVFGDYGNVKGSAGYLEAGAYDYNSGKSVGQVLGKKGLAEHVVLAKDKTGRVHELVPQAAFKQALKEKGIKVPDTQRAKKKDSTKERAARAKAAQEQAVRELAHDLAMGALVQQVELDDLQGQLWQHMARLQLNAAGGEDTIRRRGMVTAKGFTYSAQQEALKKLRKDCGAMKVGQARGLALELALDGGSFEDKTFKDLLDLYAVDLKDCTAQARRQLEAAPAESMAEKAKKGAGK